ncbi:citrulline utilization hydrolase CtlX [Geodermatophilus sp. SYSU D00700]
MTAPDLSGQAPAAVVLVRPHAFQPNPQTLADNAFQAAEVGGDPAVLARRAHDEVTALADALTGVGVRVHLFDDPEPDRPDSVFPNNWLSTHADGRVALFPMYAANRRRERRGDVVEFLKAAYRVHEVVDLSGLEHDGVFLEGTGAMVLDHVHRVAYVARSRRVDPVALERFCRVFGYEPVVFDAVDAAGRPIYHTNVMMSVGGEYALVALEMLPSAAEREQLCTRLAAGGRTVVPLTGRQIGEFAGNAIEVLGSDGPVLALSARAAASLDTGQRRLIEASARLLPVAVPTVELAGGSVRCMIAGVHLEARTAAVVPARSRAADDAAPVPA